MAGFKWNSIELPKTSSSQVERPVNNNLVNMFVDSTDNQLKVKRSDNSTGSIVSGNGTNEISLDKTYEGNLAAAITDIGSNQVQLVIDVPVVLTSNVTVPSNVSLRFINGAIISGNYTLTINGPLIAGPYKIFDTNTINVVGYIIAECIIPQWFGAVGDGITDDTLAITKTVNFLYSSSQTNLGYRRPSVNLYFPAGIYNINGDRTLSKAFNDGSLSKGYTISGDGAASIINTTYVGYIFSSRNLCQVKFENITLRGSNVEANGIEWYGAPGPNGSYLEMDNVTIEGTWAVFFDVTGDVLGSETFWRNCRGGPGQANGILWRNVSNIQSVNHTFIQCTFGGYGTIFSLNAGGNIRFFGGYTSLYEGAVFLRLDGTGQTIGSNNGNFLFQGTNFEDTPSTVSCTVMYNNSPARVTFADCNFKSVTPSGTDYIFEFGEDDTQRGVNTTFLRCGSPLLKSRVSGGVLLRYIQCSNIGNWQSLLTLSQSTVANRLFPNIEITQSYDSSITYPRECIDCSPGLILNSLGSLGIPAIPLQNTSEKLWIGRGGSTGVGKGLTVGLGNTYQSYNVTLPLGVIVLGLTILYIGPNPSVTTLRQYKVENFDGSVILIPETTIDAPGLTPTRIDGVDILFPIDTEEKRTIKVYGRAPTGVAPNVVDDFGCLLIKYI